ncbi:MAG: hypothetical protein CM15mP58_10030 [Burkholderiaceae bacterium]|nr:MAG: hypothetical protein CM15mP58_10030 [Burkholderiaceae bacterium]
MTAHTYKTNEGDIVLKCPTEVTITDRREKELNDLGFIAIVNSKGSNFAAFLADKQLINPSFIIWITQTQTLSYLLGCHTCWLRHALHITLKGIMRDKVGSFQTRQSVETYLNTWISITFV